MNLNVDIGKSGFAIEGSRRAHRRRFIIVASAVHSFSRILRLKYSTCCVYSTVWFFFLFSLVVLVRMCMKAPLCLCSYTDDRLN